LLDGEVVRFVRDDFFDVGDHFFRAQGLLSHTSHESTVFYQQGLFLRCESLHFLLDFVNNLLLKVTVNNINK